MYHRIDLDQTPSQTHPEVPLALQQLDDHRDAGVHRWYLFDDDGNDRGGVGLEVDETDTARSIDEDLVDVVADDGGDYYQ